MTNPAEPFFDADVKIEALIYLPGTCWDEEHQPDIFAEEFCENMPAREDAALYVQLPKLAKYREEGEPEEIAYALFGATGFLLQAATPARTYYSGGSYSSSWGNYWTEWLYAPTAEEIASVAVAWAEERHAKDRAEAA